MAGDDKVRVVKVVVLGDAGVGKSSLRLRFVAGDFRAVYEPTIGVDFAITTTVVNDAPLTLQIWDISGQKQFKPLIRSYCYRDAAAAIVVYDISSSRSFQTVKQWVDEVQRLGPDNIVIAIVGTKSDLEEKREVPAPEARAYAEEIGATFIETSAKEDANVSDLFYQISQALAPAPTESGMLRTILNLLTCGQNASGWW